MLQLPKRMTFGLRTWTLAGLLLTLAHASAQPTAKESPEELLKRAKQVLARTEGKLKLPDSFFFDLLPEEELKLWDGHGD